MVGLLGEELGTPENADALVTAWAKLFRRQVVVGSGARFVDLALIGTSEDALFNLQFLTHAFKACYVNRFLYHYRRDNATSVTTRYKPELPHQWSRLPEVMKQHIAHHSLGPDFEQALRNRVSLSVLGLGLNALQSGLAPQHVIRDIRLASMMTNDPKDRHVLAAAVRGGAEVLVTFNTRHSSLESVERFDLEVVHLDDFLLDQLDLYHAPTLRALVELVEGYESPAMTIDDLLVALARAGVPKFVDAARAKLY
ncbi:hypothetical protein [Tessaracoccus flavus]|uniref:VapC50 C-terminal domain-containing protein n=1 Tax=Tessaracoccus flavus TaxID=1610493 RepID=A0A1Q2CI42_9ACTN|nr:hypothetical protein [Tessaracoccus flavus]AQP45764.1 hypothetical protein RPIT_13910 [Tessaracoccus flavus]SDZ11917.1 hypothetical protein SAMN05428934_11118 [Tessaracoccus flavus]